MLAMLPDRLGLCFTLFAVGLLPAAPAEAAAEADNPATAKIDLRKGDFILFFGDSLTQLAGQEAPKPHVTKGYVRIVREQLSETHPAKELKVDWVATGGDRVTTLLKRVDKEVLARKPTVVFIQIGVNDAAGGVTPV